MKAFGGIAALYIVALLSGFGGGTTSEVKDSEFSPGAEQRIQAESVKYESSYEIPETEPESTSPSASITRPVEPVDYYTNTYGETVQSPTHYDNGAPEGATAQCRDGSYSFSQSRRGTCSHHGGVLAWL